MKQPPSMNPACLLAVLVSSLALPSQATALPMREDLQRSPSILQGYAPLDAVTLEAVETVNALDTHYFNVSIGLVSTIPTHQDLAAERFSLSPLVGLQLPLMFFANNYYAPSVPRAKLRAIRETRLPNLRRDLQNEQLTLESRREELSREIDQLYQEIDDLRSLAAKAEGDAERKQSLDEQIDKLQYLLDRARRNADRAKREAELLATAPDRIERLEGFVAGWEEKLSDTVNSRALSVSLDFGVLVMDVVERRARFTYGVSYRFFSKSIGFSIGTIISRPRIVDGIYAGLSFSTDFLHVFHSGYRNEELDPSPLFSGPPSPDHELSAR